MLLQIEKEVRQELVILIDLFLSNSLLLSDELSSDTTGERASSNSAQELLSNIEGYALLVQDFELLNQDLVSLQALVNRVPLIREQQDMLLSEQTRDLLIKKIFNRAVYLNDLRAEKALLAQMAELRGELRADDSLFVNRQQSLIINRQLASLRRGLTGVTDEILQRAESIKTYADTSLQTVSNDTTQGLKRYQQFLVLFAVISMLLLGFISYRLLFRNMAAPLSLITERLHRVGTPDYGEDRQHHVIEEVAELSAAVSQLDAAQRSMKQQDHMLQASNAELLRANRDLEQFAHVASHDLQEPLRKMQQFSALLKEDYEEILKGDGALYLNVISSSSQRMRTLINDTLEYSRTATSKQAMERVDLADVISYLQQELDLLIDESEAAVEIEALPMVYENRTGMRQLFRNLITNAIKYAKAGVAPRIQIASHTDTQNHQFIIDVRDNGMGVPSQYAERIFKPFERLVDRSIEGTGLGLPICRKVCDAHGWTIELTSTEGEGSCFSIHGPLSSIVALEKAS
jgi:signal transduction histidine kinase